METTARFAEVEAILRGAAPLPRFNLHETRLQARVIETSGDSRSGDLDEKVKTLEHLKA
jgi:hypothetical protein